MKEPDYPRIKDLPQEEQIPFRKFLTGQTCPYDPNLGETSDFYFPWDYENWKKQPKDHYWD